MSDQSGAAADDLLADRSLPGRWVRQWAAGPDRAQITDVDGTEISTLQLEERTRRAAQGLIGAGLVPGDRVVLSAPTSAGFVQAYVAALRAGLVVVPMNTGYTRSEVEAVVSDARPAAAIVDSDERAGWIREAAGRPVEVLGPELRLPEAPDAVLDAAAAEDMALLVYTSGTTGRPKGVPLTHANLLASITGVGRAWRWTAEDRLLLTLPLFHVHGLGVGVNGVLAHGAAMDLRAGFDVADVAARARSGRVSLFFGVPAMYHRIADAGAADALRALRLVVSGSAPLPATLATAIGDAAGQLPLERYGMTETMMLTGNPYDGPRRPGTVGVPFPGVEVRLAADGEIQVRGPNVIGAYFNRPDADAEAFTDDGWFRTGDLGEHDADGYLRISGRSKDLVITGGFNVHPVEVEDALVSHPAVVEAAVVGRPSEAWGEEVTAVVVLEGPVSDADLRTHVAQRLAAYKVPKRFERVDRLPRNALGKVLRQSLR
ncbi:AMP-binding protein [Baekduia soli]|uniref:AMP-binding protein n=1 Tax=Baekduia soli TaxID=496014 RepID=A0A5B8U4Z5_9ACTN|nr:AMP-binding protein [Baekduia soli]QEC47918.1 AMP-binding protein [Baekduia soli]